MNNTVSGNKPRLLYITPVVPCPSGNGFAMRAFQVLWALSTKYSVYLLVVNNVPGNPSMSRKVMDICQNSALVPLEPFKDVRVIARSLAYRFAYRFFGKRILLPKEYLFLTRKRMKSITRIFQDIDFDVIHVFRLFMAPYAQPFTDKDFSGIYQLDLDDIESLKRQRLSELYKENGHRAMAEKMARDAQQYEEIERSTLPCFDRVFVCSPLDKERIRQNYHCKKVDVLPNVMNIPEGESEERISLPFTFLFVGALGYYPNSEGIIYFCEKVLPLLRRKSPMEFRINIAGAWFPRKDKKKLARLKEVRLLGFIDDIGPYYKDAHCVLIPIRAGGGTRIKALEAFAYRKPVVSTPLGVEGIDVQHEKQVLISDTAEKFAEDCIRIMTDPPLRSSLGKNALHFVQTFYNPQLLINIVCGEDGKAKPDPIL
ncbi:MAG: glycosyltransferase family 4 protein [bacterium]